MSVDRFLRHSTLWFAEDQGCADLEVAVGRALKEKRTPTTNWIFTTGLGNGISHYDNGYSQPAAYFRDRAGPSCIPPAVSGNEYYASQRTRPNDTLDRPAGLRTGEGFFLDLEDSARRGPELAQAAVYVERRDEDVDGEQGLRLTYWTLFGMNMPLGDDGRPIESATHEGDWERADVLVERDGERYEPVGLVVAGAERRRVDWDDVERVGTHPVLAVARGDHRLSRGSRTRCTSCVRWRTWRVLEPARAQDWYGFGGAWGEVGRTSATTGPIGPHGRWVVVPKPPEAPPDRTVSNPLEEARATKAVKSVYAALRAGDAASVCANHQPDGAIGTPSGVRLTGDLSSCRDIYAQIIRKAKRHGLFGSELDVRVDDVEIEGDQAAAELSGGSELSLTKVDGRWLVDRIDYAPSD